MNDTVSIVNLRAVYEAESVHTGQSAFLDMGSGCFSPNESSPPSDARQGANREGQRLVVTVGQIAGPASGRALQSWS